MPDPIPPDALVDLADAIRLLLRRADALGLTQTGIHLDEALLSLAAQAPAGLIAVEPFVLPERDAPNGG